MATLCTTGCNTIYVAEIAIKPWLDCCAIPAPTDQPYELMADLDQFSFTITTSDINQRNTRYSGGGNSKTVKRITSLNFNATFKCLTKSLMGAMLLSSPGSVAAGTALTLSRKILSGTETFPLPTLAKAGTVLITGLTLGTDFKMTNNGGGVQLLGTTAANALAAGVPLAAITYDRDVQLDFQVGNKLSTYFKVWVQGLDDLSGKRTSYFFNKVALSAGGAIELISAENQAQSFSVTGIAENDSCVDKTVLVAAQQPSGFGYVQSEAFA